MHVTAGATELGGEKDTFTARQPEVNRQVG